MANNFAYSVLQYKHSLAVGECLNVGILFSFPNEDKDYFVSGNIQRLKCVYPNFDANFFSLIARNIKNKLNSKAVPNLLFGDRKYESFKEYINSVLLKEDSSSLQFCDPVTSLNSFDNPEKAIEEFSKILLPNIEERIEENRHNENYILKRYTDYITQKNIIIEHRMSKNKTILDKGVKITFDLSWVNEAIHLVKPVSFDLKEERDIANKSVHYYGSLNLLNNYATLNNFVFDLLIAKPQIPELDNAYQNALDVLHETNAKKEIITEEKWDEYSEETAQVLLTQGL